MAEKANRMAMMNDWPERMSGMVTKGMRAQEEVDRIISGIGRDGADRLLDGRTPREILKSASWYLRGRLGAIMNAQRSQLDFTSELFEVRHAELVIVAAMTLLDAESAFKHVVEGPLGNIH